MRVSVVLALSLVTAVGAAASIAAPRATTPEPRLLVFSKTAGFRHASIPAAVRAVRELGSRTGFTVDATEDASAFTDSNLRRYAAVVFLMTTGDILSAAEQGSFERYVRRGGGFVGVHSASDTEYDWPWYGGLVGAHFRNHPAIQRASVRIEGGRHPSTAGLPPRWSRTDEWYSFDRNPRPSVRVLATLDESSYSPGAAAMGADHPIAWSHEFQRGRAWYTAGGHTEESYSEPLFRRHLLGGIRYAAGMSPPKIRSVAAAIHSGRLRVSVRYSSCRPCSGRLQVRVRGRSSTVGLRLGDGSARATSRVLPRGRHPFVLVLEDPLTGLTDVLRRSVVVS
jgi:type 1 glutamine amidotransferase